LAEILVIIIIGIDQPTLYVWSESIGMFLRGTLELLGAWSAVYIIEALVGILLIVTAGYLLTLICITFAAVVAKKHKVIAAIAFYYITNAVISFISQMGLMFGSVSLAGILEGIPTDSHFAVLSLMALSLVLSVGAIALALYSVEHYLLDRKLNLS
jgi:hypothetical protein